MHQLDLTKSEMSIMETLWRVGRSLASPELVSQCEDRIWKPGYIHILVDGLLKKGMIEVDGFVQTGRHYSRTFKPTMTKEEYMARSVMESPFYSDSVANSLMLRLVREDSISDETIAELKRILSEGSKG